MTPAALLPAVPLTPNAGDVVPAVMREMKRWTAWDFVPPRKPGAKPAKKPRSVINDPSTWLPFPDALAASKGRAGIGFIMSGVEALVGIDLDGCLEPATCALSPFARGLLEALPDTYAEISPSGRGIRIFASLPEGISAPEFLNREAGVECYCGKSARYLTITGNALPGREGKLGALSPAAAELLKPFASRAEQTPPAGADVIELRADPMPSPGRIADLDALAAQDDTDLLFFSEGIPSGDRSERFYRAIRRLLERGVSPQEVEAWARARPGIMRCLLSKRQWSETKARTFLHAEVARAVRGEPPPLVPDPEPSAAAPTGGDGAGYEYGGRGKARAVKRIAWNVCRFLRTEWKHRRFRLNLRLGRVELDGRPFLLQGAERNELVRSMCKLFDWDSEPAHEVLAQGILAAAERDKYDPVTEYLDALPTWDGTDRIRNLLQAAGIEPSPLNVAIMTKWFVQAVARAREPGCKADSVCILVGPQGFHKSMFWRALGSAPEGKTDPTAPSETYSDAPITLTGDKDSSMKSDGPWVHELPELSSMKSADRDAVKHALSMQEEKYRPPYGREVVMRPRRGVRVGSTNERQFLNDPTGARRFWLLEVGRAIDIPWVMSHRDVLWAQADALYKRGERWWFAGSEHAQEMAERHEAAYDADNLEIVLREILTEEVMAEWRAAGAVLYTDVAMRAGIDLARAPRNMPTRLGTALTRLGFVRTQVRRGGRRPNAWRHRSWDVVAPPLEATTAPPAVDPSDRLFE